MAFLSTYECAKVLKAVAEPNRLRILRYLIGQKKNVSEMAEDLKISQPTVSHHLALLRHSKLVQETKEGKQVFYEICPALSQTLSKELEKIDLGCCSIELHRE
ncbi:MAG: ArsR/SmtB family transcription factor [Elusimicrobiota bacterium]